VIKMAVFSVKPTFLSNFEKQTSQLQ